MNIEEKKTELWQELQSGQPTPGWAKLMAGYGLVYETKEWET